MSISDWDAPMGKSSYVGGCGVLHGQPHPLPSLIPSNWGVNWLESLEVRDSDGMDDGVPNYSCCGSSAGPVGVPGIDGTDIVSVAAACCWCMGPGDWKTGAGLSSNFSFAIL